jgi:tRNA pseudouridine55 synthase
MTQKTQAGLVNVEKPRGMTSRQVVDCVKRLVRPAKTGHAGTLDPLAAGVLIVCVGAATRLIEYVQAMPKRYVGTFLLGRASDTEDVEGEVRLLADTRQPAEAELRAAAARFIGVTEQRPPAYSAIKVQGRRAYDLARAGQPVDLASRPVEIYRLDVVRYRYPELVLDVECGSGTYIRSLGRDLAQAVGTSAVMSALVRTAIGPFTLDEAWSPERLTRETIADWLQPPIRAVESLSKLTLSASEIERVRHGLSIARTIDVGTDEIAAVDERDDLVAILVRRADGTIGPVRNL